jgi:hypothetical protein
MTFKSLNIYCERVDATFWSEPTNALTNIVIFLGGLIGFMIISKYEKSKASTKHAKLAAALAMITGVGSFLFHTFANTLTMWLDIIPILFFKIVSVNFYMKFIFKKNIGFRSAFLLSFILLTLYLQSSQFKPYFNGSMMYFPSIITLLLFGLLSAKKGFGAVGNYTFLGVGIFVVSIMARSFDIDVCLDFPLGTHFIWHTLNGFLILSLLLAMKSFIENEIGD